MFGYLQNNHDRSALPQFPQPVHSARRARDCAWPVFAGKINPLNQPHANLHPFFNFCVFCVAPRLARSRVIRRRGIHHTRGRSRLFSSGYRSHQREELGGSSHDAKGDGVTDDTANLQFCITANCGTTFQRRQTFYFPAGIYDSRPVAVDGYKLPRYPYKLAGIYELPGREHGDNHHQFDQFCRRVHDVNEPQGHDLYCFGPAAVPIPT